jgi:GT2 family glycosyltransferase
MPSARLSIAIVTYRTPAPMLERCVASLARSVEKARAQGLAGSADLFLIDNSPADAPAPALSPGAWTAGRIEVLRGHGNVGYGKGNNLVLGRLRSDAHVVMNPDVEVDPGAIPAALAALDTHPGVGLVAPAVYDASGARQYLCKRYPSVWVLFLRGFAPGFVRRRFQDAIDRYEMRDAIADTFLAGIPLASGCFMAIRTPLYESLGGFDARYFLYFEDYDLSLRLSRQATLAYVPEARIVHHGGGAAAKGWRHVAWFLGSAWRFFSRHGWKLA